MRANSSGFDHQVLSNPEFLAEGTAIQVYFEKKRWNEKVEDETEFTYFLYEKMIL